MFTRIHGHESRSESRRIFAAACEWLQVATVILRPGLDVSSKSNGSMASTNPSLVVRLSNCSYADGNRFKERVGVFDSGRLINLNAVVQMNRNSESWSVGRCNVQGLIVCILTMTFASVHHSLQIEERSQSTKERKAPAAGLFT
jgi:hypothetical protein